jgi:secreted trypsin-like serine protease
MSEPAPSLGAKTFGARQSAAANRHPHVFFHHFAISPFHISTLPPPPLREKTTMLRNLVFLAAALSLAACAGADADDSTDVDTDSIIGGTNDNGDPAVVALFAHAPGDNAGFICTATVISPTVLLTAAHCVDPASTGPGLVTDVVFSPDFNTAPASSIVRAKETHFDPAFDVNDLGNSHDIAVVILPSPTSIAPKPINRAPITNALLNRSVRIVGYGSNTHANAGAGRKRQTTTTLKAFDANLLRIGTSSRQTCHGDSGGPAFMTINGVETIVGVTSFGNDVSETLVCINGGFDTRVDRFTGFVDQFL